MNATATLTARQTAKAVAHNANAQAQILQAINAASEIIHSNRMGTAEFDALRQAAHQFKYLLALADTTLDDQTSDLLDAL